MTIKEARRTLEWVEEHLECVGGPCKETYITGLKAVDELLKEQHEIVTCNDCKHWCRKHDGLCVINDIFTSDDWFYADGERSDKS